MNLNRWFFYKTPYDKGWNWIVPFYQCELKLRNSPSSTACSLDGSQYGHIIYSQEAKVEMYTTIFYDKEFCLQCRNSNDNDIQSPFFKVKVVAADCSSTDCATAPNYFINYNSIWTD